VKIDAKTSAKFLFKNIFTRFGCPLEIVSDRGLHFLNETIQELTKTFFIKHWKTTPYNPKANGLTERANGIMVNILNKIILVHKTDWDINLQSALWAYRTAKKITTKRSPFYLVYGMDSIMPVEFEVPTYQTSTAERLSLESSLSPRLQEIEKLEEDFNFLFRKALGERGRKRTGAAKRKSTDAMVSKRKADNSPAGKNKSLKKEDKEKVDWKMLNLPIINPCPNLRIEQSLADLRLGGLLGKLWLVKINSIVQDLYKSEGVEVEGIRGNLKVFTLDFVGKLYG
jgi:hypothetical protein